MKKLIKLNLKEAKYATRFPNKLIGCPNSFSTMASKEVKLTKNPLFEMTRKGITDYSSTY